MRSDLVVQPSSALDNDFRINSTAKSLHRQALIAEFAIEELIGALLPMFSRLELRCTDLLLREPGEEGTGYEFLAVVGSKKSQNSLYADEFQKHLLHPAATATAVDIGHGRLSCEFLHCREVLQLLIIGTHIEYEVVGQHLSRARWR